MNLFPEAFANEGVAPAPQGDMSFLIIMAVFMLGFYIFVRIQIYHESPYKAQLEDDHLLPVSYKSLNLLPQL